MAALTCRCWETPARASPTEDAPRHAAADAASTPATTSAGVPKAALPGVPKAALRGVPKAALLRGVAPAAGHGVAVRCRWVSSAAALDLACGWKGGHKGFRYLPS